MSAYAFRAPISEAFARFRAGAQGGETVSVFGVVVDRKGRQGGSSPHPPARPAPTRSTNALRFQPNGALPVASQFEVELEEFLKPMGLTQAETARQLVMSVNRLNELVLGKRGITADTALRLARRFHTTPQLWMHLQAHRAGRAPARRPDPPLPEAILFRAAT
jgi:antitoxin HigA-1